MTIEQKEKIRKMRADGLSYLQIAESIDIPKNTIKSFCVRNKIPNGNKLSTAQSNNRSLCEQCGKRISQNSKRKVKRFCSDKCRLAWWNSHRDCIAKKTTDSKICIYCGKNFKSYEYENRKYCSHSCYIKNRFKDGDNANVTRAVRKREELQSGIICCQNDAKKRFNYQ